MVAPTPHKQQSGEKTKRNINFSSCKETISQEELDERLSKRRRRRRIVEDEEEGEE
jgi:hypothetical protein